MKKYFILQVLLVLFHFYFIPQACFALNPEILLTSDESKKVYKALGHLVPIKGKNKNEYYKVIPDVLICLMKKEKVEAKYFCRIFENLEQNEMKVLYNELLIHPKKYGVFGLMRNEKSIGSLFIYKVTYNNLQTSSFYEIIYERH